jgi:hypothetical protein
LDAAESEKVIKTAIQGVFFPYAGDEPSEVVALHEGKRMEVRDLHNVTRSEVLILVYFR